MKHTLSLYGTALVCLLTAWALPAIAETQQQPAGQYKHIVDADFVAQYATTPKRVIVKTGV